MTTSEVANRLVELCREGKYLQAIDELYSNDIVSVEPEGAPNVNTQGIEAVRQKTINFEEMVESVQSSEVSDPTVADNFFSVNMHSVVTFKGAPGPADMNEICVYQVKNGKVVAEQFFYTPAPQPVS